MARSYGVNSMSATLTRAAMRRPRAILTADPDVWHYGKAPNAEELEKEYAAFTGLLRDGGTEIVWLADEDDGLADSVFTYDPSFVVPDGAILLQPGKVKRRGEVQLHQRLYENLGIPIIGKIELPGTAEGGDCFWLDASTIAIGRGFRTNTAGIDQLSDLLAAVGIQVAVFDLPYYKGPDACLHLMSLVSPLDEDMALVYDPLLPAGLKSLMTGMGYKLLEVPEKEFESSGGLCMNVLATAPRRVIMVEGFSETTQLLREAGCEVSLFRGDELCIPCEGGPTCLTRPLLREQP